MNVYLIQSTDYLKDQAISCYVGPNEDGERAVDYTVYGQNYIMPKLKNTVLDLINDK